VLSQFVPRFPTRKEVAYANTRRLGELPGRPQTYQAQDQAGVDHREAPISHEHMVDILDKLVVPNRLELKVGAQVMLIKVLCMIMSLRWYEAHLTQNLMQGYLVNGSIGRVTKFATPKEAIQSNIRLAQVESDKNRNGSSNTEEILEYDFKWPVVKFTNSEELVVTPVDFTVNNGDGRTMMARRFQLPLILAWALSVHKSQGQTLERVRVDLRRTFEKGQAYVALSRATSMEHLQVRNFSKEKYVISFCVGVVA